MEFGETGQKFWTLPVFVEPLPTGGIKDAIAVKSESKRKSSLRPQLLAAFAGKNNFIKLGKI